MILNNSKITLDGRESTFCHTTIAPVYYVPQHGIAKLKIGHQQLLGMPYNLLISKLHLTWSGRDSRLRYWLNKKFIMRGVVYQRIYGKYYLRCKMIDSW